MTSRTRVALALGGSLLLLAAVQRPESAPCVEYDAIIIGVTQDTVQLPDGRVVLAEIDFLAHPIETNERVIACAAREQVFPNVTVRTRVTPEQRGS